MSLDADEGFREAVTRSHTYARSVIACDESGEPIEAVEVSGGSIQVGSGLVRRTASIVIANTVTNMPRSGSLIWWDHPLLVRFIADGLSCDMPLLWPDEPDISIRSATINLGCRDAMRIVSAESRLANQLVLADDYSVGSAIRRLLVLAGATDDDAYFDIHDGGHTFLGGATYESGAYIGAILEQWQVDFGLDLYAMPPAVYTVRPIPDPLTQTPVATWTRGRDVKLLDFRKQYRSRAVNHAIVEGLDPNRRPFRVEVFDQHPDSPVRWGAPGVPDLPLWWRSDGIRSHDQAETVARSLLVANRVEETIDATVPVDPSLDRRDVVTIEETSTDTVGTFALDSFSVPLEPAGHSVTVRRERNLE